MKVSAPQPHGASSPASLPRQPGAVRWSTRAPATAPQIPRPVRYTHDEAEVLGEVLQNAGIRAPILVGHSDGASIALIYAGSGVRESLRALILEAPHVFAEPMGLESITLMKRQYETNDGPEGPTDEKRRDSVPGSAPISFRTCAPLDTNERSGARSGRATDRCSRSGVSSRGIYLPRSSAALRGRDRNPRSLGRQT